MNETDQKPLVFAAGSYANADIEKFRREAHIWKEIDIYPLQLRELFEITNPSTIFADNFAKLQEDFVNERLAADREHPQGNWIYFPWSGLFVHTVTGDEYIRLRTNRNRNIVTEEEQKQLLDACVGIIGLSVGSGVAAALAYSGIARNIKLAEFDTLETTNLNRIRAGMAHIGMPKIDIAAQQVYEIDPYINIQKFTEKMDVEIIKRFIMEDPKPRVIFEIIDSFEMKIHLRALAREQGIPVIMVTNLGDRVLMDVERYDLDKNTEFFNGRAGNVPKDILENPDLTAADKHKYAVDLAGVEHIPQRALDSVKEIGKTLVGRPQLASTVTVAGGVSAYLTRKIILGTPLPSASWLVDLDKVFSKETAL